MLTNILDIVNDKLKKQIVKVVKVFKFEKSCEDYWVDFYLPSMIEHYSQIKDNFFKSCKRYKCVKIPLQANVLEISTFASTGDIWNFSINLKCEIVNFPLSFLKLGNDLETFNGQLFTIFLPPNLNLEIL